MESFVFYKMTGGGNDFILVEDMADQIPADELRSLVPKVCRRRFSVGADGFIVIKPSERAHFRWLFFNSDGSEAEMCGNGGRCAARLAHMLGIAPAELSFETAVGIVKARVRGAEVKISLPPPHGLERGMVLDVQGEPLAVDFIDTGVPHAVIFVQDLQGVDVEGIGRRIRFHEAFQPAGTNVDFVKAEGGQLRIRTYERGVEGETLACGTGAVAAALLAHLKGLTTSPTVVLPKGAEPLTVHYRFEGGEFKDVALEGRVRLVFKGELKEEALW